MSGNIIIFPKRHAPVPVATQESSPIVVDESVPIHIAGTVEVLRLVRGLASVGLQVRFDLRSGSLLVCHTASA